MFRLCKVKKIEVNSFFYCGLVSVIYIKVKSDESITHSKSWFESSVAQRNEKEDSILFKS